MKVCLRLVALSALISVSACGFSATGPPPVSVGGTWTGKVDAPGGNRQIENYRSHAGARSPVPLIITMGRNQVNSGFAYLTWSDNLAEVARLKDWHRRQPAA